MQYTAVLRQSGGLYLDFLPPRAGVWLCTATDYSGKLCQGLSPTRNDLSGLFSPCFWITHPPFICLRF